MSKFRTYKFKGDVASIQMNGWHKTVSVLAMGPNCKLKKFSLPPEACDWDDIKAGDTFAISIVVTKKGGR